MDDHRLRKLQSDGIDFYVTLKDGHSYSELQDDYKSLCVNPKESTTDSFFCNTSLEDAEKLQDDERIDVIAEVRSLKKYKQEKLV